MSAENKDVVAEKEIDLLELGKVIWLRRKLIIYSSIVAALIGVIVAFSIPKEYSTTVVLAPDAKSAGASGGGMGALAAMAGINLQQQGSTSDIPTDLYPTIVGSTPFVLGLFDIKVKDERNNINTELFTYLKDEQKQAWWSYIFAAPSKLLGVFKSKEETGLVDTTYVGETKLSTDQFLILEAVKNRINIAVDKKTSVITLSVTMQSPQVSAYLADTVVSYLQDYIIKYRTKKACDDLAFTEKLYSEAQQNYYKSQQNYAAYSDGNLDIISARYGTTRERLQNEMNLAYSVYNQMAQQLQMAKVKVQDTTPVYTIIEPPVVPHIPEKPNKKRIVLGFIFVAFFGTCVWIIIKDYFNISTK
ncbi:MAG: hypothetical protein RL662_587 [Bacteroidota bacterium]|jgi:uncharacterized protein involved in exopolysaccharide biosynthesis